MNAQQTGFSPAMHQCLVELDVVLMRKLYKRIFPHLPQPQSDLAALTIMHMARTQDAVLSDSLRFYSHRWLLDQGHPSQLPDQLKPNAERMYPTVAESVGISVNSKYPEVQVAVHGAMRDAVMEAYEDGRKEPGFVGLRMQEARRKEQKKLFG